MAPGALEVEAERNGEGKAANTKTVPLVEVSPAPHSPRGESEPEAAPVSFLRLFSHATALDWTLMALGTLGAVANGCAMPLFALAFGSYTGGFTAVDAMAEAREAAIKFVYLSIAVFVAFYLQAACWIRTGSRQASSMRIGFLQAVMRQDVAFFENQTSTGSLLRSLNDDTAAYQQAVSERLGIFIQHVTTFVVGFAVAFWRGWDMTLVLLACLPFLGAVGLALSKLSARIESSSSEAYAQAQDLAQQALMQVRTVAAFGMEQGTVDKYDRALDLPEKVGIQQGLLTGLSLGSLNLVLFSAYAASLYYGATRVAAGAMAGGDVLAVMMAALLGAFSLGQAAPLVQFFLAGRAAAGRLTAMDSAQPGIDVNAPGEELAHVSGELRLQGVSFEYPSLRIQVLNRLDLHIPAGQTLALVGSSGSGKSTIISLLQRFYEPSAGAVLLDGVDIRRLQLRWLRSQMALVSQEASLFATTIYENIAMGRPDATQQEVLDAARAALVDSFVSLLPQGYQTHVGSRGIALSGGQRQRIAIARAILKNPRILLLDEATSALDSASEAAVSLALQNLAGHAIARDSISSTDAGQESSSTSVNTASSSGRTVVMVAHRLSTVRHADTIVVMARGKVVEQGTHQELMSRPHGSYANLVQLQSRNGSSAGAIPSLSNIPASEHLHTLHSVLDEQESYNTANSGWSTASSHNHSGGQHNSGGSGGGGGSSSKQGWFSRLGRLRRRSNAGSGHSGGGASKDVETAFHSPRSSEYRNWLMAAAAAAAASGGAQGGLRSVPVPPVPSSSSSSKQKAGSSFWRLMSIVKSEAPSMVVGALGCMGHGSMMPAFACLLTSVLAIFHLGSTQEMLQQAHMYAVSLAGVGVGACCCVTVQFYCFGAVGSKLARRLRVMLLGAMLHQEIGWHDQADHAPSKMASLLATDTASARGAVADVLGLALQTLGALGFGYAIAIYCDWRVALLVTGLLPLLVSGGVIQTRYMLGSGNKAAGGSEAQAAATTAVTEALAAIHVVQSYNLQERVCGLYRRMLDAAVPGERKACHVAGLSLAYSQAAIFLVTAIVVYFGGAEVSSGRASFENMLKAFMSIVFAAMGVAQAMVSFPEIGKAGPAVERMMRLLHPTDGSSSDEDDLRIVTRSSSCGSGGAAAHKAVSRQQQQQRPLVVVTDDLGSGQSELMRGRIRDLQGSVDLVRVWFSYPARPDVRVLQDFSLEISARSTIALVGRSGSGKSTIISLLQRFYEPDSGTVLLDGVDIRCLDLKWLRQQMGLVSQECLLFQGTIEDNIRYGTETATSEQVVQAAKAAYAHEFILAMPQGYQTIVGGKGAIKLSGGQRQRLAIARAIIRDPKILLLDEATSALDAASEAIVTQALNDLATGNKPKLTTTSSSSSSGDGCSPTARQQQQQQPSRASLSGCGSASSLERAAAAGCGGCGGGASGGRGHGRTTIIVAHRLATITAAETIAVMSPGGKLLELGSPSELLGSGGKGHYAQMVMQQHLPGHT